MSSFDNHPLPQNKFLNPLFEVRYVDDMLTLFKYPIYIR